MSKCLLLLLFLPLAVHAQDNERRWSLQAGFGEVTMLENKAETGKSYVSEDQGNTAYLAADYFLSDRLALTGGLIFEQQGLFTDYASGIGLKKVNMLGLQAGAKYYFFPKKWIFQPHIGGSLHTNVLNLGRHRGKSRVVAGQGFPGSHGELKYDVQCPALSVVPCIGVDIRLLSSLSLCLDYDYRIGLWGRNRGELRWTDGPRVGQFSYVDERNVRGGISIGLRMDFPVRRVSRTAQNTLLMLLHSWIASKSGN